jgi:hypothetical protein
VLLLNLWSATIRRAPDQAFLGYAAALPDFLRNQTPSPSVGRQQSNLSRSNYRIEAKISGVTFSSFFHSSFAFRYHSPRMISVYFARPLLSKSVNCRWCGMIPHFVDFLIKYNDCAIMLLIFSSVVLGFGLQVLLRSL